ncbi:MAG: ATP-binding protein [Solirubrobacteraceae bacterium]
MLRVWLFGVLRLEVDGVHVAPPSSRRARLLLAMLAVERRPHSREALAARLWPGALDERARASLRTALARLRAALGPNAGRFLEATGERVMLAGRAGVWTDLGEFERLLGEGQLHAAVELSRGGLLTGLEDEWVYEHRDKLQQRLSEAFGRAAGEAEGGGDLQTALLWTRRQVALDPLAEGPVRELIRRLACAGDRAAALVAYNNLSQRLREQLGMVPSSVTREFAATVRVGAVPAVPAVKTVRTARVWHPLPRPLQSSGTFPFVGRRAELERLCERWADVCVGARATVVIGGEAGIGKTRLASELAQAVHRQDGLVLYGRCDEGLAVPYQPFVEALRLHARAVGVDRLRTELRDLCPELGRLVPELSGLGEPVRGDPESERFALFEAIAAFFEAITRELPVVLVLEDLHWAANPTLLLLRHLIRCERPIRAMVLITYRETELEPSQPLAQLLTDFQCDASVEGMSIGGLDGPAIAALLEAAVGRALDEGDSELVGVLRAQTAGNPFFLRELLAHLAESAECLSSATLVEEFEIPEGLRDVIAQRVARLIAPVRRVLSVAAVAGPTFPFALLERVLGEDVVVPDALGEAVAAGLLTEIGHGDYAFSHALVRETIYGQLGSARRIRLHRQLGEAIEALEDHDAHVEALAHHFAHAAADGQGVKAAKHALAAGRRATARLGYEEAAAHYERGLEALTLSGQPPGQQRCDLLLALGEACWGAGALDKARQAYEQAAELAEQLGDAPALARAALGFCGPHRFEASPAVTWRIVGLLERALAALRTDDSALRAQLMGRLAAALAYMGVEYHRPVVARQALEMARRVADKATLADVLASSHRAWRGPDVLHESLALARELGCLADEIGDGRLHALAHRWLLDFLLELGDIAGVERELKTLQRLADTRRERYFTWILTGRQASHAHLQGRLESCEMLAHDALAHRFEGPDDAAAQIFGMQMVFVRREQGRLEELVETVKSCVARYPQLASWRCVLASIYAELERQAQARQELNALARTDFTDLPRDTYWLSNLSTLCDVVAFLGDAPRAQLLYKLLLPYADRCVVIFALICQGSASRALGVLAATLSLYEDAARHFEHALKMNTQIRSPLWIAHTQHDYAQLLLRRNDRGDRDKALRLLEEALATAEQLQLKALADKARPLKLAAEADAHRQRLQGVHRGLRPEQWARRSP